MLLEKGDKVLIVHRRLFESDRPRLFMGEVKSYEDGVLKATGRSWTAGLFNNGEFVEKGDPRTKLFALGSGTLIAYELPRELELSTLDFEYDNEDHVWLTDGDTFRMNLTETERVRPPQKPMVSVLDDE